MYVNLTFLLNTLCALADPRGSLGTRAPPPLGSIFFSFSWGFRQKSCNLGFYLKLKAVAELHSKILDEPSGPNSFNFMQFLRNFGEIVCWCPPTLPPRVGAPTSGKSWIRHCKGWLPAPLRNPGSATDVLWSASNYQRTDLNVSLFITLAVVCDLHEVRQWFQFSSITFLERGLFIYLFIFCEMFEGLISDPQQTKCGSFPVVVQREIADKCAALWNMIDPPFITWFQCCCTMKNIAPSV